MSLDIDTVLYIQLFLAILVNGLNLFLHLRAKYKQTYWARRGVHTPPGADGQLGHVAYSEWRLLKGIVLADLYLDPSNGDQPVDGVYIMQKPVLLLRSPSVIKQVLVKDSELFFNPRRKYLMSKMGAAFSGGKPKALFSLMLEAAENMRRFLEEKVPTSGEGVKAELLGVSTRYTVDVMSSFSFGIRTNSFQTPDPEFYTRCLKLIDRDGILLNFIDIYFPFLMHPFRDTDLDNSAYFRKIFWKSMNEREKSGAKRGDIIDSLLDLKNEQEGAPFKFDDDYLADQSIDFFIAGQGSASTIDRALMALALLPEIQEKVRNEIRENIGDEGVAYESIGKMTYLNQVISETLRLYPPGELLYRVANENYKIPDTDIVIEKGTVVCVPLLGLHEDPAFHPDPETFDPERFSEERKKDIKPCTYMPFGDGPKKCLGSRIGLMQTAVALITILRDYEVSADETLDLCFSKSPV